jgi:hypothetical protein
MKQLLVVVALFLAALAVSLWALGVFDASPSAPVLPPAPPGLGGAMSSDPGHLPSQEPTDEPRAEVPPIEEPLRVLVMQLAPRSFTAWLFLQWDEIPNVSYQAWSLSTDPGISKVRAHSHLPELQAAPSATDLQAYDVLVLDDVDPSTLPPGFLTAAAERVRSGRMGLLLFPGSTNGLKMAQEQNLAPLTPVRARPVPEGVFKTEHSFAPTEDGRTHIASRLSSWPNWSAKKWAALAGPESKWGTTFVFPADPEPGSKTLLDVQLGAGRSAPALVASDASGGRVLWVGMFDAGQAAFRPKDNGRTDDSIRSLAVSWLAWLAKRD